MVVIEAGPVMKVAGPVSATLRPTRLSWAAMFLVSYWLGCHSLLPHVRCCAPVPSLLSPVGVASR